jgi:hypothetical protein
VHDRKGHIGRTNYKAPDASALYFHGARVALTSDRLPIDLPLGCRKIRFWHDIGGTAHRCIERMGATAVRRYEPDQTVGHCEPMAGPSSVRPPSATAH